MKELGHHSFRFSISWARLFPDGKGRLNKEGGAFYNRVIDELLAAGIEPFVNLYHFDMPLALQQIGGWENRQVVDHFASYAETCFRLYGDRVKKWFTHNEPIVPAEGGYLYDFHYPNIVDFQKAVQVAYHEILSNAKAVEAYRRLGGDGKIGIILNLTPSYPRSQHPADVRASEIADAFFNRSFLDPAVKGEFPQTFNRYIKRRRLFACHGRRRLGADQKSHCRSARHQLLSAETGESEGAPASSGRAFYAGTVF